MAENITTVRNSLATKIFKYWVPVLIMLAAMYHFSTDIFSGENTRGMIQHVLGWFLSDVSPRTIRILNYGVRKLMHFVEYAVLAALLFRAFRADSPLRWRWRWAVYSLAILAVWAMMDEYHQSFTELRGGSLLDVLLDCSGGVAMLTLVRFFNRQASKSIR